MRKNDVCIPSQALAYMTDCTIATVADMAMKKSRSKREYRRQISIAQAGVDWVREMYVDYTETMIVDVVAHGGSVADWARQFEPSRGG